MNTSQEKSKPAEKQKALCVATRCTSVEQFVATFHRFCDESSFFVATLAMRPVGLETAFSIQLEDKTPVLRGLCVVVEAWATPANRFGRPGVRLDVKRLTNESIETFAKLQVARLAATVPSETAPITPTEIAPPVPAVVSVLPLKKVEIPAPAPFPRGTRDGMPPLVRTTAPPPFAKITSRIPPLEPASIGEARPVVVETRTPGSSFVLPANPLMNLSDKSLEGFIDCALYEETGNFFRTPSGEESLVDIDDVLGPPMARGLVPMPALRQGDVSEVQPSYIGPMPEQLSYLGVMPQRSAAATTPPPIAVVQGTPAEQQPQYIPHTPYPTQYAPVPAAETMRPPRAQTQLVGPARSRRAMIVVGSTIASFALIAIIVAATSEPSASAPAPIVITATPATSATVASTPKVVTVARPTPIEAPKAIEADPNAPPVVGNGPCRMTVATTPAGSIVRVDEHMLGASPLTIDGPCKRTKIEVKHPRYAPGAKWVNLAAGTPATVDIGLNRPTHAVTVITSPAGATISIGGRRAGTSPTSVKLMGFTTLSLTIEKKGYTTVVQKFYSKKDSDRVSVKLTRGR